MRQQLQVPALWTSDANMLTHFLRGCWETNNFAAAHYGLIKYIHIFMTVLLKQQAASVPCLCSLCTMGASFSSVSLGTTPFFDPKKRETMASPSLFPSMSIWDLQGFVCFAEKWKKRPKKGQMLTTAYLFSCSYERVIFTYPKAFYLFAEQTVGRILEAEHIQLNLVLQRQSRRVVRR